MIIPNIAPPSKKLMTTTAKTGKKTKKLPTGGPNRDVPNGKTTRGPKKEACLVNQTH